MGQVNRTAMIMGW